MGKIIAISISSKKGVKKVNVENAVLIENHGIKNDAHAGTWERQVSILDINSIKKVKKKLPKIKPGDFAENITTDGLNLTEIKIGSKIKIGKKCLLEVTQIGKRCHKKCEIFYYTGDCIMPREGIFTKVLHGGLIQVGDKIEVENNEKKQVAVTNS